MTVISANCMKYVCVMYMCVWSTWHVSLTDVEGRYLCCIVTAIVFVVM